MFENNRVETIAEVGLAHEGSLGVAHAYIDAAASCGVTAVKFQTHLPQHESTAEEKFRVKVFPQDATRYDYWQRTAFEPSQWKELSEHATSLGLDFLSSPFSNEAVELLMECNVSAWKVASGELTNHSMLRRMAATGKPVMLSSGMSSWQEIDAAAEIVKSAGTRLGIFQCTTSYPCPPEKWGLNTLAEIRDRYSCPAGLSDHSGSIVPSIAAVTLGASMLEFHVAFSKDQFGPDSKASLTFDETRQLVSAVDSLSKAIASPIDKNQQAEELKELHRLFTKSIVAASPLESGHVISESDLAFKKPGTGMPANHYLSLVGKRLNRDVAADHFFSDSDFAT